MPVNESKFPVNSLEFNEELRFCLMVLECLLSILLLILTSQKSP